MKIYSTMLKVRIYSIKNSSSVMCNVKHFTNINFKGQEFYKITIVTVIC